MPTGLTVRLASDPAGAANTCSTQSVVKSSGVDPDGTDVTSTNTYHPEGPDSFTLQSSGAKIGDKPLPDFTLRVERETPDSETPGSETPDKQ